MDAPAGSTVPSVSRRLVLGGLSAAVLSSRVGADEIPTLKVGTLPFGAVQWTIETIIANGFDRSAGIKVENVLVASNEAARIAFLSRSVDSIANDLLFAVRLKSVGKRVLFLPYTSTEGGLMAPAASPIRRLADLKGKSIGVAGGPLDKNWLLLEAAAKKNAQFDLANETTPIFGAPPLLAAKLESGELDCGLLFWSYCARLLAKGYRQIFTVEDIAASLGAKGRIALGGFLFYDSMRPQILAAFGKAVHQSTTLLSQSPEAWKAIRPLMQVKDDATFEALKSAFLRGIPHKSRGDEIADARSFFAIIAAIGGAQLVGSAKSIPDDLYVSEAVFG